MNEGGIEEVYFGMNNLQVEDESRIYHPYRNIIPKHPHHAARSREPQ